MYSEIRRVMPTASNSSLKQFCSAHTLTSALEVIFNVMRSINPRFTYLLVAAAGNQYFLACIARRVTDMEQLPAVQNVEQFVTKQDLTGKILACDTRSEILYLLYCRSLSVQFLMLVST